jgi:hypothetical protein
MAALLAVHADEPSCRIGELADSKVHESDYTKISPTVIEGLLASEDLRGL